MSPLVGGVDGCPAGWAAVVGPPDDPSAVWLAVDAELASLVDRYRSAQRWAIDMPIGLATGGPRPSDAPARRRLGPARSASVFTPPPLATLGAANHREACDVAQRLTGKRVSLQAWNLMPKVRQVRSLLLERSRLRRRVFETHPELGFARLAHPGAPSEAEGLGLPEAKKTAEGRSRRVELLAEAFGPETVGRLVAHGQAAHGVGTDDALDAMVCWLAAARAIRGRDERLPEEERTDETGLPLAIRW